MKKTKFQPYISFVMTGRNDNYAGNFLERMQTSLEITIRLIEKFELSAEIIIVDWNSPKNKNLRKTLTFPKNLKNSIIRIIEVPSDIHKRLPYSNNRFVLEYTAKNVGARHANGEYILATNPDIIFNTSLIKYLASKKLSPNFFYRSIRYDVKGQIPANYSISEKLEYCEKNINKVYGYLGTLSKKKILEYLIDVLLYPRSLIHFFPFVPPHTNAAGDFFLMHKKRWLAVRGYPEIEGWQQIDGIIVLQALFLPLKQKILGGPMKIYHQEHPTDPNKNKYRSPAVEKAYKRLMNLKKAIIFNSKDWGLAKYNLTEAVFGRK